MTTTNPFDATPETTAETTPTTTALLGEIVTWDLRALEVPYITVRAALVAAGLPTDSAQDLRIITAFRRALKDFKEGRTIDKVDTGEKGAPVVHFQFTQKALNDSGILAFDFEAMVHLNLTTGEIICADDQIERHAREQFDHAIDHRTTSDVTRMVQTLFAAHADLYPINPRKGVAYFVPEAHREFSARVEAFLVALGGSLLRFPVPKGTPEGNRSVKASVEAGLTALAEELDKAVEDWTERTHSGTFDKAVEKWTAIKHKAECYSEYLGDRQAELLARLDETKRRLAAKVMEIEEAKDGERPLFAPAEAAA